MAKKKKGDKDRRDRKPESIKKKTRTWKNGRQKKLTKPLEFVVDEVDEEEVVDELDIEEEDEV